jgi:hypothetical protein
MGLFDMDLRRESYKKTDWVRSFLAKLPPVGLGIH